MRCEVGALLSDSSEHRFMVVFFFLIGPMNEENFFEWEALIM